MQKKKKISRLNFFLESRNRKHLKDVLLFFTFAAFLFSSLFSSSSFMSRTISSFFRSGFDDISEVAGPSPLRRGLISNRGKNCLLLLLQ